MHNNNSSKTIAFASGGYEGSGVDDYTTNVDRITINSLGNAVAFATLATASGYNANASNTVRSIVAGGGAASPGRTNRIEFNSFQSGGSGTDFGDLTAARSGVTGGSNGHGGIDEFFPRAPELYSPTGRPVRSGAAGVGDIAMFNGGNNRQTSIDFFTISTLGNSLDFGDSTANHYYGGSGGNSTRYIMFGDTSTNDVIDYVQISTKGNAADFGNLNAAVEKSKGAMANNTRTVVGGEYGNPGFKNIIEYVVTATIGNSSDFGDLTVARSSVGQCSSSTRGVVLGGATPTATNVMDYVTIANTGNATDFGDTTVGARETTASSSTTRGVRFGARIDPNISNVIDYITIASTGDAQDFGDLAATTKGAASSSNNTRAVAIAGNTGSDIDVMQYVTIASTGNAADFGDLSSATIAGSAGSNCHGGLS